MSYQNIDTQLSDYPFKAQVDWLLGTVTASSYDAAINKVWERVNYAYCGLLECIRKETVQNTINAYVNMLKANKDLPVYNWYYVEVKPEKVYVKLVTDIAQKASLKVDEVKKTLKQLQFADADGSIVKGIYDPRVVDVSVTKTPKGADSWDNKAKEGMESVGSYLKWGAIGGGVILLAILANKVMKAVD